jgi:hypothetical protein
MRSVGVVWTVACLGLWLVVLMPERVAEGLLVEVLAMQLDLLLGMLVLRRSLLCLDCTLALCSSYTSYVARTVFGGRCATLCQEGGSVANSKRPRRWVQIETTRYLDHVDEQLHIRVVVVPLASPHQVVRRRHRLHAAPPPHARSVCWSNAPTFHAQ